MFRVLSICNTHVCNLCGGNIPVLLLLILNRRGNVQFDLPSTTSLYKEDDEVKATTTQTVMTDQRALVHTETIDQISGLTVWLSVRSTTAVINRAASVANNQLST